MKYSAIILLALLFFAGCKSESNSEAEKDPIETLLLALYLVRKRVLTFRKDYVEGGQVFGLYEINSTEEMIAVKKVPLQSLDLTAIKLSIASKLTV